MIFYKEYLTEHERTHTRDKQFQCKFCKKGFSQKRNLTEHGHLKRTHSKINFVRKGFPQKKI